MCLRRSTFVRKRGTLIAFGTLLTAILVFIVIFVIIPVIYRYSYVMQRNLLFLNFVSVPVDFENPQSQELIGAQNYRVKSKDNVTIGVWHILPNRLALNKTLTSGKDTIEYLNHGEPIMIYLHGNSGNRGTAHRVHLYRILQENNFHIVAFDYRSYGDSSYVEPTEEGVVADSRSVYHWVKEKSGSSNIFLWGHSLGTGISSHLLDILEGEKENVSGIVLESPFNNMSDEIRHYPLARFFKYLPWFDYFFVEPVYENGFRFESDMHLSKVKSPIMILHAEDDIVVPLVLGEKLYEYIKNARKESNIASPLKMHKFSKADGLGHKYIYKSKQLTSFVLNFVSESLAYQQH
ncbi:hypothetical protein O3M35_004974 [Rhynocoris fuscipes]|uniref:AB hydrolase-1 domain-containing protein n=1 Tax=Rhynocoris fuscipes TaxID=488301 RepID=A0AAW1DGG1_9HEMI